jgi:hypothetical protein
VDNMTAGTVNRMKPWQRRALEQHDTEQLVALYAEAYTSGETTTADTLFTVLYERHMKAFRAIARERSGYDPDEAVGDVIEVFLESCRSYEPDRSSFDTWWRDNVARRFSANRARDNGGRAWDKVARVAKTVANDLPGELGRMPNLVETREAVVRQTRKTAENAVRTAAAAGGEQLEQDDIDRRTDAKLRKDGTAAALRQLPRIMATTGTPLSLDMACDEHGSALVDMLAADDNTVGNSWLNVLDDILDDDELRLVLRRSGDRTENGWRQIATEEGVEWTTVRKRWNDAVAKPLLPHAQFAYLTKTARFEPALDENVNALDRFRGRVAVAGGHALAGIVDV